jgi:Ca-activated chloride channel family protein
MLVRMQWPGMLWALALLPVAVAAYLLGQRRRARYAARFTNLDLLANVVARSPGWRRHLPAALYLLALAGLLLALARPQATVLVPKQQANVLLIMDVSGSINATDVAPTRLLAAVDAAGRFVDRLPSAYRVGLISFSTTAQLVASPTTDRQAVHDALSSLQAEGSTAIGDAIERALDLKRPPPTTSSSPGAPPWPAPDPALRTLPMVILLPSDGANTTGRTHALVAADHARQLGVPIYAIALGTQAGTVDVPDEQTGQLRTTPVPQTPPACNSSPSAAAAKPSPPHRQQPRAHLPPPRQPHRPRPPRPGDHGRVRRRRAAAGRRRRAVAGLVRRLP